MAIKHDVGSAYIQERRKWETHPVMIDSQWVVPQMVDGKMRSGFMDGTYIQPLPREEGGAYPYIHQEFPKVLYKAERADGGPRISETITVHSEQEESNMLSRGWSNGPNAAIAAVKASDLEASKLHAELSFEARRMSEPARKEFEAAEDAASTHLPSVPTTPIRKRPGRKPKTQTIT